MISALSKLMGWVTRDRSSGAQAYRNIIGPYVRSREGGIDKLPPARVARTSDGSTVCQALDTVKVPER